MAASRYRKFLKLMQRWPVDAEKGQSRDLAVRIREDIMAAFAEGDKTVLSDDERCDKICTSLEQLVNNKHYNDFPTKISTGAVCPNLDTAKALNTQEARDQKIVIPMEKIRKFL